MLCVYITQNAVGRARVDNNCILQYKSLYRDFIVAWCSFFLYFLSLSSHFIKMYLSCFKTNCTVKYGM